MGRKEYFETLEHLKMLRNEATQYREDIRIEGMNKREFLNSIDRQLEEVKKMVNHY